MRHSITGSAGVTVLTLLLAACHGAGSSSPSAGAGEPAPANVGIRVMTFNIEWGGANVSFANVVEAIKRADADIVGIQEAEGNLAKLAAALGWRYDLRNYVVSRYPLLDPPGADGKFVFVEVRPGYVIAIANLHLPSDPYGPDLVRDGAMPADVLANEHAVRMPALRPFLDALEGPAAAGMPVIVTGDFNTPAHTDWTDATVGTRPYLLYAVAWPVSLAMQRAGFTDTWRSIYPDVAVSPGLTWWAARPPLVAYAPGDRDPQDRIDQIWYAGPVEPVSAILVGEAGRADVAISVTPWPSDHRAVIAAFHVTPVRTPPLLTTDRHVYLDDDSVLLTYVPGGHAPAVLSIVDLDADRTIARRTLSPVSGTHELLPLPAGRYRLAAMADSVEYQRDFRVLSRDARPSVELDRHAFHRGDPARVRWRDGPGHRNDYIAIYAAESAADVEGMLAWVYVDARPDGSLLFDDFVSRSGWSPSPGTYLLRLMKDDGYEILAESGLFEIHRRPYDFLE